MLERATDPNAPLLLADIGGTTARFALRIDQKLGPVECLPVAKHERFDDALAAFLFQQGMSRRVHCAVIAVAAPVWMGCAEFTNSAWKIDAEALKAAFGFAAVKVVNDFEAVARALPALGPNDLLSLGGHEALAGEPLLALGPGTGLGVACLVPRVEGALVISSEAGHANAPSWSRRTDAIIDCLRSRHGRVSAERVLSGQGLENLFAAIVKIDGLAVPARTAAEITQAAIEGRPCSPSREAVELFFAMLGEVAGDLALAFGARGGVYITGGVAQRLAHQLAASAFRTRFEDKGRLRSYLQAIPCWLIVRPNCAFLGLETIAGSLVSSPSTRDDIRRPG
jgi:glucokinase